VASSKEVNSRAVFSMGKEERGVVPHQEDGQAVFVFLVSSSLHRPSGADDPEAPQG
jgi:hypothetical protein